MTSDRRPFLLTRSGSAGSQRYGASPWSGDVGATWAEVNKPMTSAIVDSTMLADGRLVAVGIGGEILMSTDNGVSFAAVPVSGGGQLYTASGRIYAVSEGPEGTLLVGGPNGIHKVKLPQ